MDIADIPREAAKPNFRLRAKDMNVMELIEEVMEVIKIAALNLWTTNRKRSNIAIDESAQKMKDIRSLADKNKLQKALDNIGIALRATEILLEIGHTNAMNKTTQDIVRGMLDSDNEEITCDDVHSHCVRTCAFPLQQ